MLKRFQCYKFPLLQNSKWSAVLSPGVVEERTLTDVNRSVQTPAGVFEGAIVVESRVEVDKSKALLSKHYFVAGVGIVKIETYIEERGKSTLVPQTVTLLKGYKVKNKTK